MKRERIVLYRTLYRTAPPRACALCVRPSSQLNLLGYWYITVYKVLRGDEKVLLPFLSRPASLPRSLLLDARCSPLQPPLYTTHAHGHDERLPFAGMCRGAYPRQCRGASTAAILGEARLQPRVVFTVAVNVV